MRRTAWALAAAGFATLACRPAAADCVQAETGGNLGSVPSQRVLSGPAITTTAQFTMACGGIVLSALGTPTVRAKFVSPTSGLTLKNGSNPPIPYQVTDLGGLNYTQGLLVINASGSNVLSLLSNNTAGVPLRITTSPGANVPAGTYTDTLSVNWEYANICEGLLGLGNLCVGTPRSGNVNRLLTVQLVVTNDCTFAAPDVQFGAAPLPSAFPTVTGSVSVVCTRGLSITVGLGAGTYPAGGRRQMASGGNRLAYDLFRGDGSVWGTAAGARVAGTALTDGITPISLPYTGRVYGDQSPPPPGVYQDNVVVDVQF
ncbi:spore coat U domain-containing protein [Acidovorax sp. GBBC 3334]|uniref:Csu type fimbrial protein n=1 Tax=Acidovorax sp. GBBC 3334 TaxID=2940496 RepID=UPI0023040D15|nr:spore coat U domain-containing protein [Acidovorax sp. GBBC 3334]MDA8456509.1 spore coat U domain-containing protein [Acidovorax sp. GBBC 3334]